MKLGIGIAVLLCIAAFVVGAAICGIICFKLGINHRKKIAEAAVGSAEKEADRIVEDAKKNAESLKKEALLEAKDEIHKSRQEAEKELKERRSEVTRQERRINQKEESLDKKLENLEKALYGTSGSGGTDAYLPTPDQVYTIMGYTPPTP